MIRSVAAGLLDYAVVSGCSLSSSILAHHLRGPLVAREARSFGSAFLEHDGHNLSGEGLGYDLRA